MKKIICLILFLISFSLLSYSQELISRIDIQGNEIVSDATIVSRIKIRANQDYNENIVNEDIKNLYATGFFETVEAKKEVSSEGIAITFKVKEKPVLKKITVEGARFIRKDKILGFLDIKEGSFVDEYSLKEATRKIKDLYTAKGFFQAEITYDLEPLKDKNEVTVAFLINEKGILKVRRVQTIGNSHVSTRKILRVMKTRKAWLFNRGIFKEDVLADDINRLTDYYKLQGFSDAVVKVNTVYKPKGIYLNVVVEEGQRYHIGEVTIEGNHEFLAENIYKALALKTDSVFSEQAVYYDASKIRELYVDRGYIFSQVQPRSVFNPQTQKVDVNYTIVENQVAYIEDIEIRGNIKTKDKVIRREIRIYPGDKFDGKKVRKSKERLENLGFFEEMRFGTDPGSESDKVDLVVDVKEAKTGYLSFGGGYSSIDAFIGFVELRQRNFDYRNWSTFTGAGQDLTLQVSMGTLTDKYQLSFTNPWIFDKPVSFGFDVYKKGHQQDEDVGYAYEEDIRGGTLRLGREFSDQWKADLGYRFERVKITDIVADATQELKDEAGITDLSSGRVQLSYDSRDNVFSPSKGFYLVNSLELFGGPFSGDRDFVKYFGNFNVYFPMINKSVVGLRLRAGISDPFSNTEKVPIYERFFAGGAASVRGYRERKVGPIDSVTEDPIGGEALFVANFEYTYPLASFIKVATFFDTGNTWKEKKDFLSGDLKSSIGLGLRVKTPIGPVSIDYGWPLDLEPGEDEKQGRFHFNISRGF
ncbi:MAG: outer membrane protein assembly factor BamA [Candidatus Omnitrophica bacterium]|nr:outer membrane protein assembly factor BamA [Candidatus Omnitrophota bacterium]MBU2043969.1 outer membrane protein assembly factor BamA [Candidatus Omnitrophota bacterium]MBU2473424.1 outer membrane protein assembly factor BamA [Candidatus Omnitrophota bacterium]